METLTTKQSKPLAIIGLAAKYAQEATDVNRFWKFLLEAREATTSYPKDRLNHEGFYHPDPEHAGTTHTRQAQFLSENPNAFDAAFFSISKTEAESLDPQQRLVMENVYHALENAGLPMSKFVSSNTSVFAAGFNHDHRDRLSTDPDIALKYQPTGAESSMISGRVSWFYDFKGPSLTVETACSSSMVAFHLATQSLHAGESDMSALRSLQTGQNMGKIVCVPKQTDEIPCTLDSRAAYSLDPSAAYILAGGMGGIGRSIAHWMVMRGARHLVFLNRTPQLHAAGQTAVSTLEAKGCQVQVICCDIANAQRTKAVLQGIRGPNGASIRGCIICALALADSAFGEMSHRQWQEPLKAKVQGSWNLHQLLSSDNLQFFVMLSSVAGVVGNRGQANYNAGNTFQNAIARLRVSQGLPGVSIDLGAVDSVGFTAEHRESLRHSFRAVTVHREDQMLAIIDHALDPRLKRTPQTCQLVCGLATRSAYEQRCIPLPPHLQYPLFMNLRDHVSPTGVPTGSTKQHDVQTLLATAQSEEAAVEVALVGIRRKLSSILSIAEDEIDPSRSVRENGVGSLIEMEFRTWISRDLGLTLDKADFNVKSLHELSVEVAKLSSLTHYN
ncbi:KR-domain-containing protein [Aspergillus violaceofuscus CBS 115571]|uniref:KR-domain-containing protein n=1 Tax=Aspergillus violaceofuscus (strain CBS 115571) TaxID=1450538 RepID=A0A2V5H3N8_ASPV1|nr:KR-domain-containing protein [Aspergillus violaceofuscus CBS 115571]